MSDKIVNLDTANFDQELNNSDTPVLVDFWAEWCGPCKMIAPLLDEVADEYGERIKIAKVDADAYPELLSKFGIRGIPTLMIFKDGKTQSTKTGALSKSQLTAFIEESI